MPSRNASEPTPSLREQLVRECSAMVRHLLGNGTRVPAQLVQAADQYETALAQDQPIDTAALASTHERLARLVAPAKPATLYLLDYAAQQTGAESGLGTVKLVRDLVRVAVGCVVVFILLSVMSLAEAHPDIRLFGGTGTDGHPPHDLLVVKTILERVFWLAAAGIGASFAMLFQLNDRIVSRTYDPDERASHWVKFFLGVVAGFILVALVPFDTTAETGAEALGPPTVALLGGFSASAVYRILTRMVEALESVFSGGAGEQVQDVERAAASRSAEEAAQARISIAETLVGMQHQIAAGATTAQLADQLRRLTASLLPGASDAEHAPSGEKVRALAVVSAPEAAAETEDSPADAPGGGERDDSPAPASALAGGGKVVRQVRNAPKDA